MPIELIIAFYILINVIITILYILMAFLPNARLTRKVIGTLWSVAIPALVHVVFAGAIIAFRPGFTEQMWRELYIDNAFFGAGVVTLISHVYGTYPETAILHGWVHIVVGDLFMARWAWFDGPERGIPTWQVSVLVMLIGFIGPIGFVAYLIIRDLRRRLAPVNA